MSTTTLGKARLSRRSLFSTVGGAAGGLVALGAAGRSLSGKSVAAVRSPAAKPGTHAAAAVARESQVASAQAFQTARALDLSELPPADERVLKAVGSVKPGTDVDGWKVVGVYGVYLGAIPVIVEDKQGNRFQVDVCAKDTLPGAPKAVTTTKSLSFFLANGGNGARPSVESQGLGAMALARRLSRKRHAAFIPDGLLTLRARNAAYPHGAFRVAV